MKLFSVFRYVLILLLLAGMGCEETVLESEFAAGKVSTFRINQLYTTADGQNTLLIKEISDSRCPEGVVCVWAGEVIVKGEWTANNNKSTFEIHSVTDQQKQPAGYTIKIVDAQPYPKYGTDSKPENLVISLLIQKN